MNPAKQISLAAVLNVILALNGAGATLADSASELTMKPLQGVSFDVGTKRAVSYFLKEGGACQLILTLAEPPTPWDDLSSFTVTRFEATVPASGVTHYNSSEGGVLEFACESDASSMSVKAVDQVATAPAH